MEMKRADKVHYVEPSLLAAAGVAVQGFTTRHEGVSRTPYNSLNLGTGTADSSHSVEGNRSILARAFGGTVERLVTVTQVHGTDLLVIDAPNPDYGYFQRLEADGIITNQPGVMIGVCVADCVPVLLLDPVKGVAAALHAGWKGTASGICRKGWMHLSPCSAPIPGISWRLWGRPSVPAATRWIPPSPRPSARGAASGTRSQPSAAWPGGSWTWRGPTRGSWQPRVLRSGISRRAASVSAVRRSSSSPTVATREIPVGRWDSSC